MKLKKWLISLGLALVLVVAFALPACEPTPAEYWYTPEGEKISFDITTIGGRSGDIGLMAVTDLQDFGFDVTHRVIDSTTFFEYLYEPQLGGMETYITDNDPGPDPWSDWIWIMLADPEDWGYMWNPTWYNDERYNELWVENYIAPNLTAKQEVLHEIQEKLAQDVPLHFLVRNEFIAVHRTDGWGNWFNEMGGYVTWINEYSLRECTKLGDETQLKVGTLALMPNLNMDQEVFMYTNVGCLYLMLVYENLAFYPKVDEDLGAAYDFVPKLATGYEVTYEDDGAGGQNQVWTIDLREGVKWHDYDTSGKNLTADDVVYTIKYVTTRWDAIKPVDWVAVEANDWEILPEHMLATKTGEYQVELRFVEGWHNNEDYLPNVFMWDAVVPEHVFGPAGNGTYEGWNADPLSWDGEYIGTGPYKVKEWVPDSYLLLERNDDYWGPLPEAEQVLFKLYTDTGPLFLALEAGDIDVVEGETASFAKFDDYEADPNLEVETVTDLSIYTMGFNIHPTEGYEPLQDVVLRQAIAYAIDKQNIVDIALGGYGEVAYSWTYNESPNLNPDLTKYDYDTTAAETLLLDAGYTKHE
jgi:ABC-type transport system substrate-binding protein